MKILLFLVLKVVEILVVVFIPYGVGRIMTKYSNELEGEPKILIWAIGLLVILLAFLFGVMIYGFVMLNIDLVNRILG